MNTSMKVMVAALSGLGGMAMAQRPDYPDFEDLHRGLQISQYLRGAIESAGGTPIAVLAPYEMTRDASTAEHHRFKLKINRKGYTALMGNADLDYVITGAVSKTREQSDYRQPYEDFDDGRGGSLAFGFRGADYQVELYCLAPDPDPRANCLVADDVEALVATLVPSLNNL
jgi:hypothetical protein